MATPTRPFIDDILQKFAQTHISYELRVLSAEAEQWGTARTRGEPADAALEASLVHIRLLDEFLGFDLPTQKSRFFADVRARDYDDSWKPTGFLVDPERDDIGAQVAHLTLNRVESRDWAIVELAERAFAAFDEFCRHVEKSYPTRAVWLRHGWGEVRRRRALPEWQPWTALQSTT